MLRHKAQCWIRLSVAALALGPAAHAQMPAVPTQVAGYSGSPNSTTDFKDEGKPALTVAFSNSINGLAVDPSGNLYLSDQANGRVLRVDALSGLITTAAGCGSCLTAPDHGNVATGPATLVSIVPGPLAFDSSGDLYIADENIIREVTPGGLLTTVAGSGNGGEGALALAAKLGAIGGLAVDSKGSVYCTIAMSDPGSPLGNRLVEFRPGGAITTVMGDGSPGSQLLSGAQLAKSQLNGPGALAIDPFDHLYIADTGNGRILKLDLARQTVSVIAGPGPPIGPLTVAAMSCGDGDPATQARLLPVGLAADGVGNVFFSDDPNSAVIHRITPDGVMRSLVYPDTKHDVFINTSLAVDPKNGTLYFDKSYLGSKSAQVFKIAGASQSPPLPLPANPYQGSCLDQPSDATVRIMGTTAAAGGSGILKVLVTPVADLEGAQITLAFDPTQVTIDPAGAMPGSFVGGAAALLTADASKPGQVSLSLTTASPETGSGVIASMPFKVIPSVPNQTFILIQLTVAKLIGTNGRVFPAVGTGGSIAVTGSPASPPVTTKAGDVNGDGRVTIDDAVLVLRLVVGLAPLTPAESGALGIPGKPTVDDAVKLLRFIVGLGSTP